MGERSKETQDYGQNYRTNKQEKKVQKPKQHIKSTELQMHQKCHTKKNK